MSPIRATLLLVFAAGVVLGGRSAFRSYEQLRFYTDVEPDLSAAESYEVELWLKIPVTLACLAASLLLAKRMIRREE